LIAGLWAMVCSPVWAGLYLPVEKGYWRVPSRTRQYRLSLDDRQGILPAIRSTAEPPSHVKQMLETVASLEKKYKEGQVTLEEGISLGGYYILLDRLDDAIVVMEEMIQRNRKNFLG